jgi:hypothetical protein
MVLYKCIMAEAGAAYRTNYNECTAPSKWLHFMRFVRLALGTYIGIQAYQTQSILSALLAGFIIPSLTNLDAVEP